MPISTCVGEEQLWLSLGLKSQLVFALPPGRFPQFRQLIWFFVVYLECIRRWAALLLDERQIFTFLCTFALSQGRALRRDTGLKGTKRSWGSGMDFLMWYHCDTWMVLNSIWWNGPHRFDNKGLVAFYAAVRTKIDLSDKRKFGCPKEFSLSTGNMKVYLYLAW